MPFESHQEGTHRTKAYYKAITSCCQKDFCCDFVSRLSQNIILWCGIGRLPAGERCSCWKDGAGALKMAIDDYSTGDTGIKAADRKTACLTNLNPKEVEMIDKRLLCEKITEKLTS
jgi:hypothetical protein